MLVSNGTLGRQEGGHAPSWAHICLFPSLPPPVGFPTPRGTRWERGRIRRQEGNGEVRTAMCRWGVGGMSTPKPPSLGPGHRCQEGRDL